MATSNPLDRVDLESVGTSVENRWVINDKQTRNKSDVGNYLATKGAELEDNGAIEIEDERVQPNSEINTTVRYEKSSSKNQILIKMEWDEENGR